MPGVTIRELKPEEVSLCVEGGKAFFSEAKLPGGFEPEHFIGKWSGLTGAGIGTILGAFEGERILGALGSVFCPNLYNSKPLYAENFWFMLPEHRGGSAGMRLLHAFEKSGIARGAKLLSLVHTNALQPERLGGLFVKMGYPEMETVHVKEVA